MCSCHVASEPRHPSWVTVIISASWGQWCAWLRMYLLITTPCDLYLTSCSPFARYAHEPKWQVCLPWLLLLCDYIRMLDVPPVRERTNRWWISETLLWNSADSRCENNTFVWKLKGQSPTSYHPHLSYFYLACLFYSLIYLKCQPLRVWHWHLIINLLTHWAVCQWSHFEGGHSWSLRHRT